MFFQIFVPEAGFIKEITYPQDLVIKKYSKLSKKVLLE